VSVRRLAAVIVPCVLAWMAPVQAQPQAAPAGTVTLVRPGASPLWIGQTRRGYLGVHLIELSEGLRQHYGAPDDRGVMVSKVEEPSPASRGGIRVGDVILSIDEKPLASSWASKSLLAPRREGDRVRLSLIRDGRPLGLAITLEERTARIADLAPFVGRDRAGGLVLLDPRGARRLVGSLQPSGPLPPAEEIERALEAAVRTLRHERLPPLVRTDLAEKRRLEERIRELERRLQQVEAELARGDGRREKEISTPGPE